MQHFVLWILHDSMVISLNILNNFEKKNKKMKKEREKRKFVGYLLKHFNHPMAFKWNVWFSQLRRLLFKLLLLLIGQCIQYWSLRQKHEKYNTSCDREANTPLYCFNSCALTNLMLLTQSASEYEIVPNSGVFADSWEILCCLC